MTFKQQAETFYKGHREKAKAIAAGTAIDNALKLDYTKGGVTHTHFMIDNYLKYFTYERLPQNRKK